MAEKFEIKINHLTSLHEARFAAGMGVAYIGFNVNPSEEDFITFEKQKTIFSWIDGVNAVAETGNWHYAEKLNEIEPYAYNFVETSNPDSAEFILRETDLGLIFTLTVKDLENFSLEVPQGRDCLLHIVGSGDLNEREVQMIASLSSKYRIFLSYGFDKNNLKTIADKTKIAGITLNGSREETVGIANFDENAELIEIILEEISEN